MKTYTFERTQFFPRPLNEIFPFFRSPENLGTITPSWLKFRILTPLPVVMKEGTTVEYTISWLGIPMRWKTLISSYEPPFRFSDIQLRGPYALWEHTHSFREVEGGTEMHDHIRYALPLGVIGRIAHALGVRKQIRGIFAHRAVVLEAHFRRQNLQASVAV